MTRYITLATILFVSIVLTVQTQQRQAKTPFSVVEASIPEMQKAMTELANWVAGAPTPMAGNYSAVGGFGLNPYDPRRDPREATGDGRSALATGGSSSGIGTAANFWAGNVGTDTGGSILQPSNANML